MSEYGDSASRPEVPPGAPVQPGSSWPSAGEVFGALPATEILSSTGGVVEQTPRRRRTAVIAGVAAVAVLAAGGAGLAAFNAANGSGSQPEEVLPASTIAFLKVDLDPSAGQKLELYRLLQKFPHSAQLQSGDTDFGDWLVRRLVEADSGSGSVSYAKDVKPWLGKRFALAAVPGKAAGTVDGVLVLQDSDDKAAAAALEKIRHQSSSTHFDYAFAKGYVVVAPDSSDAAHRAVAAAASAPLAGNAQYTGDVASLHSDEVVTGWADATKVGKLLSKGLASAATLGGVAGAGAGSVGQLGSLIDSAYRGRYVLGMHAADGAVELQVESLGGKASPAYPAVSGLDHTAADAFGVLAVTGIGSRLGDEWKTLAAMPQYSALIGDARDNLGLDLPGDLETLLGSELDVSLGGDLKAGPTYVAAATSKDADAAKAVLDKILGSTGAPPDAVGERVAGDVLYVGSDQGAVDSAGSAHPITKDPLFATAVPGASSAQVVLFVDLTKVWASLGGSALTTPSQKEAEHVAAVGLSARQSGTSSSFTLRVVLR